MDRVDWNTLFMSMAHLVAQRSPDEQTKIGAVLVGHDNRILSLGFNGFPRGCSDQDLPTTRPEKYFYMVHAEANCLINASIIPYPADCKMYVTARPCPECTKQIIQYGIGKVIYDAVKTSLTAWNEEIEGKMHRMLKDVPLKIWEFDGYKEDIVQFLDKTSAYVSNRS